MSNSNENDKQPPSIDDSLLPEALTEHQLNIINGTMLGDACITNGHKNRKYQYEIKQRIDRQEYLESIKSDLTPFVQRITTVSSQKPIRAEDGSISRSNNDRCYAARIRSRSSWLFTDLREKWYLTPHEKRPKKIVPDDLVLNWQIVAFWYCDDGTCQHDRRQIDFCSHGFDAENNDKLVQKLAYLNLNATMQKDGNKFRIHISNRHYDAFLENVSPFIKWDCFQYKARSLRHGTA